MFFKYTFVTGSRDCTYNHFHSALSIQVLMDIYTNISSHLFFMCIILIKQHHWSISKNWLSNFSVHVAPKHMHLSRIFAPYFRYLCLHSQVDIVLACCKSLLQNSYNE